MKLLRRLWAWVRPTAYGPCNCGFLDWTIATYGRLTHKHNCPARREPWCQSHPDGEGCRAR